MGNELDYQRQTSPKGPSIYADYFFFMAFVGSAGLALISLYGFGNPMYLLGSPLGPIAGMVGWGGWIAYLILGRRSDMWFWGIGVVLALATLLLFLDISSIQS